MSEPISNKGADLVSILSPWASKPGGLFFLTFSGMISYSDYGSKNSADLQDRIRSISYFTIITAYIASAKQCLTDEVKNVLIDCQYAWGAAAVSKEKLAQLVDQGANMSQEEIDQIITNERQLVGTRMDKSVLYYALCCSGSDGMNSEEIIRFLRVGRHMGVSENELNNLLVTYFHECKLIKEFERNITGQQEQEPEQKQTQQRSKL